MLGTNTHINSIFNVYTIKMSRIRFILVLQNSSDDSASLTSITYDFVCRWYANTSSHHASSCLARVSKFGCIVKNGLKSYCHGHWNDPARDLVTDRVTDIL